MKTTYLIWKDLSCYGTSPDWLEITGQEFLALVRSPEAKGRYFIKLESASDGSNDCMIVMEATEAEYHKWRVEKRHRQHLRDSDPGYRQVSYHAMEAEDGCYGEDFLEDSGSSIEADYFGSLEPGLLEKALQQLTEDEYRLIETLYLRDKKHTEKEYSVLTGIPQQTVNHRKRRILHKLKIILSGDW